VLRAALACLLLAFVGCGGGESSGPPVATSLVANSSTSATGVVGGVVTPAPSVIVKDQNGSPMGGEAVTFAVVSGGGSVAGATVTTDASGVATVGSWTLGPATGDNVVRATSGSLDAVVFTATSVAGPAASIAKNAGDNQTALAGAAVPVPPSVVVKDANGNLKAGASVTFAIESGGGTITGATATTNSAGVATVGSWTLGSAIGQNALRATSGTLASVVFTASSVAGAAASVAKNAGDNQSALAGTPVAIPPSVLVKDANGNPRPGVTVTFAVVSGGGSITGPTAVTNTAGIAAVGTWTLGGTAGANSLSATVAGLPPVTFVATGTSSFCTNNRGTHTFGTTSGGTLSSTDCQFPDGSFVDFFNTSVPDAGAYIFRQGATFDTYLLLAMPNGVTIGENDDEVETSTNSGIKALLPPGEYLLGPGSFEPGVTGDYQISSATTSADVGNCETVFVVRNITTNQNLAATDCNVGSGATPIYSDVFFIFLNAGASVTVNMTSPTLDSFLQLVRLDGLVVAENDNVSGTTKDARVTFTATQTNYYAIFTRSIPATATGAYTLTVQ
jgi:hypothetical protein